MNKTSEKKLNKEQLQAVKHSKGPLLIIAGAGTGKTTVITERIKYLIAKGFAKPEEILALTFTEKAATEMETRVDEIMPLSYGEMWIMTFHSFCDRILRDEALHVGLPSNYRLMTEGEQIDFFKKNLFEFSLDYFRPLGNPNKFISELLKHFSRLQDEVVTPVDYANWNAKLQMTNDKLEQEEKLEQQKWLELATVYKEYNDLKIKEGKFDFGDLIIKTIELFNKRPNILLKYQEKFKFILVDEFQDTNFAQNVLINILTQKYKNITTVGDDNQSVYRFRGAAISNIIQFKNTYSEAKIITLNKNYRSTQTILDSAYKLIKHNDPDTLEYQLGISKKLVSCIKNKELSIKYIQTDTGQKEAEEVIEEINKLVANNPQLYNWNDIAILVRANNHADSFIREFERKGIPHQFLGPNRLLEREEIIDLISYLKALYNIEDSANLYRLFSSENLDISPLELIKLMTLAKRKSVSFFNAITDSKDEKIINLLKLIDKHLKNLNKLSAGEILYDYVKEVGIYEKVLENEDEVTAKNISSFFEKIKAYENENPKAKLPEVVDYISLLQEVGESPSVNTGDWQENNAVNILTVHSAKGLEFPVVFLVNLVNERFPSRERHEQISIPDDLIKEVLPKGDFHLEEERRLFYVGMTRAKERLFLTAAKYYGDGKREKIISPFVMEALGGTVNSQPSTVNSKTINTYSEKINHSTRFTDHSSQTKISFLSVSQIETFKTCPMHYKLKYIYKLVTPMSASISFGISIHETLQSFYIDPTSRKASRGSLERLILDLYRKSFLEEGYLNKKHKQEFYKKGESYLLGFLKNGYNPKIKTIELEKAFKIKINPSTSSGQVLTVGGKIDRIDDLGGGEYEVIDYKTGASIPTQKEVDRDLQLSVYSLAVSQMFNVSPEKIKLSLYYLDIQEKLTTKRTKKDLEKVKQEILEVKKEIEESDFKCSNGYFCQQGCELKMFCKSND